MKVLKVILIVLASIVVLLLIGIALLPSERTIDRSILVSTSADKPFKLVNDLKNWTKWSPWYHLDTTQTMEYSENTVGEDAWYTWDSKDKNLNKGKLTITSSDKPDSVIVHIEFSEWDGADAGYYFEKVGENETKVSQRMKTIANGFFGRLQILIMEGVMNSMFDQGLASIKSNAEAMPDEPEEIGRIENMGESQMEAMMYLAYTDTASISELHSFFEMAYGEIMVQAGMQSLEQAGPPFALYKKWDPENGIAIVQCGIPVNKEGKSAGNIEFVKVDAQKVIAADYFGPYEGLERVHNSLYAHADAHGVTLNDMPYEFYMNDPGTLEDPALIHTRVCYPLK